MLGTQKGEGHYGWMVGFIVAKNDQGVGIVMMPTPCFIWRSRLESNQWPVP